jgi:hypothetical protein
MDHASSDTLGVNDSGTCEKIDTPVTQRRSPDVPRKIKPWGFTYFVQRGDAIKIGQSAIPKSRISSLQTSFPDRLETLAIIPNTIIDEPTTHQRFAHLRMAGEWFRAEPELIEFILAVKVRAGQSRPAPKPDTAIDTRRSLIAKRAAAGAKTPIGYRCSNLIEMLDNFRTAEGERRSNLAKSINRTMAELAQLSAV